jgi:hypothetical protein
MEVKICANISDWANSCHINYSYKNTWNQSMFKGDNRKICNKLYWSVLKCGTKIGTKVKIHATSIPNSGSTLVPITLIAHGHSTLHLHSDCPWWTFTTMFYSHSYSRSLSQVLGEPRKYPEGTEASVSPESEMCRVTTPIHLQYYVVAWIWSCSFKLWIYEEI